VELVPRKGVEVIRGVVLSIGYAQSPKASSLDFPLRLTSTELLVEILEMTWLRVLEK
jgi:hypothetical protein